MGTTTVLMPSTTTGALAMSVQAPDASQEPEPCRRYSADGSSPVTITLSPFTMAASCGGRTMQTCAAAGADMTVSTPEVAVALAMFVRQAEQGFGICALKPSLEGELCTSGTVTPPNPLAPKAEPRTTTVYPST